MADEAYRSMLESGWKNIGRKGSRAKLSMKSLEAVEPTKPAPTSTVDSTPSTNIGATTSASIGATSLGKLGSWAKLLSKNSLDEPPVVQSADESATGETAGDSVPDVDVNDDMITEAVEDVDTVEIADPVGEDAELDAEYPDAICEVTEDALEETDNVDQVDEVAEEGMDVEEYAEGQEVTEDDLLGEEEMVPAQDSVAEEMEEEAVSDKIESTSAEVAKKPVEKPTSTSTPEKLAVPKPADKPPADDDDDCIMIDDDDEENMAGADFRQALDDLPSGKVMKTAAKVAIRPKPPGATPPKPPGTAPPKTIGSQGPKTPGAQGPKAIGAQGNPNIRQATPINTGNNANTPKAKGGIVRTSSGFGNQAKGGSITPTGNQAKAGSISPQGNQAKGSNITPINRSASSPKLETSISGGKIIRTNSGNVQSPLVRTNSGKGGTIKPAIMPAGGEIKRISSGTIIPSGGGDLKRTNSSGGTIIPSGGDLKRTTSSGGTIIPAGGGDLKRTNSSGGTIIPSGGGDLKRANSSGVITPMGARNKQADTSNAVAKRARTDTGPIAGVDGEGRRYNLNTVVVNFANVGASYAKKVLKRDGENQPSTLFDWEGVRRCVHYLGKSLGLKVIGVIYENFWATDNDSKNKVELPKDISKLCESIEETPRIIGKNHGSADDEMTIKCAYHRNCRFMDNDNYRDWKQQLRDEKCRNWLDKCQDLLHMRYYFDSSMGVFETLDGNVPPGLLAPDGKKIPVSVSKRDLWTASNK